jgi:uncharacterized membrane protein
LGITSIVREGANYNQTPLYFILLRGWMMLGSGTDVWARLLSALLGTAFIGVFYSFACEVADKPVPIVSTTLLTLSPLAVWHSQDARMYALMLTSAYLGLLLLLRYLRKGSKAWLVGACVAIECSLYTHLYMIVLLPVVLLFVWIARRCIARDRLRGAVVGVLLVGVGYAPWIWAVMALSKLEAGFYRSIEVLSLPYVMYAFSVGYSMGPSVMQLHDRERTSAILLAHWETIFLVAALFGTVFLLGIARVRAYCGRSRALVALLLILPVVCPMVITLTSRVTFNARYAIVAFPAYLLILGVGLSSLRFRVMSRIIGAAIIGLMLISLLAHYYDPKYAKADTRAAYNLIETRKHPGDCVLVVGVSEAFRHYEEGASQSRWLDFRQRDRLGVAEKALQEWSIECSGLWLVAGRMWEVDPYGVVDDLVGKSFRSVESSDLPGLEITRYRSLNFHANESRPSAAVQDPTYRAHQSPRPASDSLSMRGSEVPARLQGNHRDR